MREIPAADKTLATIGAILWSVQVIPQIVKSFRTKSTDGLSPILMFIWGCATIFQGSYLVSMKASIPLQVQPQAFGFFCVVSWGQCLRYGSKYSLKKTLLCMLAFYCVFAGFETGSVYALLAGERHGVEWPKQMYGWITSALLIAGLLPQYYEIYKHGEVVGISIVFMLVDILGGVFSGVSLFFRTELDSTALVQYMLVVVLDGIVVLLKPILNPRAQRRRERMAALAAEEERTVGGLGGTSSNGTATSQDGQDADEKALRSVTIDAPPQSNKFALGQGEDGRSLTMGSEVTAVADTSKEP